MQKQKIVLKNVRVHNLQNINLELTPGQLIAFTGVSGSGKSSLAFDTLYVEGQRRYIESLSPYARRRMGEFPKPDADLLEGLSPSIAIEQKTLSQNPRSTVGTLTGIYDFLRVLFARIATPYCPISQEPLSPQSAHQIVAQLYTLPPDTSLYLLSPYLHKKKSSLQEESQELLRKGFTKARIDGTLIDLMHLPSLDPNTTHTLDLLIDRIRIKEENKARLTESVEIALEWGQGMVIALQVDNQQEQLFSTTAYSPQSGLSYPPLEPQDFSPNHPQGMCKTCQGLGCVQEFDITKILDPEKSIAEDCCKIGSSAQTIRYGNIYRNLAKMAKCSLDTPWKDLPPKMHRLFLYGTPTPWTKMTFIHPEKGTYREYVEWKGVLYEAKKRYLDATSDLYKKKMETLFHIETCPDCQGSKLAPYPSAAKLHGKTLFQLTSLPLEEVFAFFATLPLTPTQKIIGEELVKEVLARIQFLQKVGLEYLTLHRSSPTLSGGEGQRVRLASQIGSGLVGATYILDEPSIGLHPKDNQKLLSTLFELRDKGNTVIIVEHDEETIAQADYLVDIGPKAGKQGGRIVAQGTISQIIESPESLTGAYLSGRIQLPSSHKRKRDPQAILTLQGARQHNLKNLTLNIPLGLFTAITGVSGSGKSSLIVDTLYPALSNAIHRSSLPEGPYQKLIGIEKIDKVIAIDQSPIGRTPRSNPATYVKVFDEIRDLFAQLPESKALGFAAGRFSFNVKEGCCETCQGMGMVKVDMDFLEEEWTTCTTCQGKRFDENTLLIRFKGKTIHDILEMTIGEAQQFFIDQPKIFHPLHILQQVGLDYLKLGQPSPTLSGGEAERIKLAKELARPSTGKTLFLLDEPTTGLHFHDIHNLLLLLQSLLDKGNTVLVIEHNTDLIQACDWIIDMGPGAGNAGGEIIAEGTVAQLSKAATPTGKALQQALKKKEHSSQNNLAPTAPLTHIQIRGACQNNLRHVDAQIPIGCITVCTGPSGSGKSSFAFETIYAEGQRRYTDSLSHYARQFLEQLPKPKVDFVEGLSAAIAIEQKKHAGNPRSTIGTMTEIYDYLRILYAHAGEAFCPQTGEKITHISKESVARMIFEKLPAGDRLHLLAPIAIARGESFTSTQEKLCRQGFLRIRLNGEIRRLEEEIAWDPKHKNELLLVVDRVIVEESSRRRIVEALETADSIGKGHMVLMSSLGDMPIHLSFAVEKTGKSYPPLTPHSFSFNTDQGMCFDCQGLGFQYGADESLFLPFLAMTPIGLLSILCKNQFSVREEYAIQNALRIKGIEPFAALSTFSPKQLHLFLQGEEIDKKPGIYWKGLIPLFVQCTRASQGTMRYITSSLLTQKTCPSCLGSRLSPLARNVRLSGVSLPELCHMPLTDALCFLQNLLLPPSLQDLLADVVEATRKRLRFLEELGLGYLSLGRSAPSLSGGETQRIHLSRQLGSGLTGCLYVLDEPTIGLHPYDNEKLNKALEKLRALGNTLLLVEHDPMTMKIADYLLDFGPGAGKLGGRIIAQGTYEEITQNPHSLTGLYLSGKTVMPLPTKRRKANGYIQMEGVSLHNLQHLSVQIPTGILTCLTGVSGSGKSTLLMDILQPAAEASVKARRWHSALATPSFPGLETFRKVIVLDQMPAGHTSRADISTYTDLLTPLRQLFAALPEAGARGLEPKHFSFNHKKGMCTSCLGLGTKTIPLQFLPAVKVTCDACQGLRLQPSSLQVTYKGKNLGQILQLSAGNAQILFQDIPPLQRILRSLIDVGLDYLLLGQEIASLSGGESQRLRLSCELAKKTTGKTLYLLDEPSIGLHNVDIAKLIPIFHRLVDEGHTVVLIEHNLDLIAQCDYLIDIGPGAGPHGGKIVAQGTPEEVSTSSARIAPFLHSYGIKQTPATYTQT